MPTGDMVGYLGILLGLFVGPPQLYKLIKTNSGRDISLATYGFLCLALVCYLWHAIHIKAPVFIIAQSLNLIVNTIILVVLIRQRSR